MNCVVPADLRVKLKENKKRDKYMDLAREFFKKTVEHESDGDTNYNWSSWYSHQRIGKGTRLETIQTTKLLSSVRILRRFLETWRDFPSLKLQ